MALSPSTSAPRDVQLEEVFSEDHEDHEVGALGRLFSGCVAYLDLVDTQSTEMTKFVPPQIVISALFTHISNSEELVLPIHWTTSLSLML